MRSRNRRFSALSIVVILALTVMAPGATFAQEPVGGFTATSLEADSTLTAAKTDAAGANTVLVPVIVKLEGDSLAAYKGGVSGLKATSPAVTGATQLDLMSKASVAYLDHLAAEQGAFEAEVAAAIPAAEITYQFDLILNGVAMVVPADQIDTLASLPGVAGVYPDELLQLTTNNSPQFIGAPTAWAMAGGQENAGAGVIVGVLDTGIWPEHPSLSDPDPLGNAYPAPPPPPSGTRSCDFTGGANPGPPFTCNNKLIGAQRFMSTYTALNPLLPDEYTTARDDDGHGTHTATTAAGNGGVAASIFGVPRGIVSGMAPRAHVMAYKVCGDVGCYSSDSAAAVQEAIRDGVNAINFSISGGTNPYSDAVELAFLDAYAAGVFVAASAGNSGPTPETTAHRGPWVTTVAASTQDRSFDTTATLTGAGGATLQETGTTITAGIGPNEVVVPAVDVLCIGPFAPGTFTGKIVLCKRGTTGRAEKGYAVLQGGAVGMILYNNAPNVTDLETDNHWLPAVQIQYAQGVNILNFLAANPGATASWPAGAAEAAQGDVMASFSSRGGPAQSLGVSKPDITAPGVQILAGHSAQHVAPPPGVALGPQGELFQAIAGTSMSSPHIAGSGALLKSIHPEWTPGQIKSALMTTAWTQVVKEDGTSPANPFDDGSGRVDLNVAGDPGLTFDATAADYVAHQADLWNANYPSVYIPAMPGFMNVTRVAHSLLDAPSTWNLSVMGATDFTVSVEPSISVPAGGNRKIVIKIDASNVPIGEWRTATVYLNQVGGNRQLHIPVTFVRKQAPVTLNKTCAPATIPVGGVTTCTITAINTTTSDASVSIMDRLPAQLRLVPGSVVGGVETPGNLKTVTWAGTLAGAQPPDIMIGPGATPAGGYLPLSLFGIAPMGVSDDSVTNFNVPAFLYGGEVYTRIGMGSNGYAIVDGSTGGADVAFVNQNLPDPTRPNNVIAPFWTDLNPPAGGALRVGTLTDGVDTWLVLDWEAVKEFSSAATSSFQIWIGVNTDANPGEDVSIAYGPIGGNGDGGFLTAGAENRLGNRGQNYYYNGAGVLPANGTQLRVTSTPPAAGGSHTITLQARGFAAGKWVNQASMIGDTFQGTSTANFPGEVTR